MRCLGFLTGLGLGWRGLLGCALAGLLHASLFYLRHCRLFAERWLLRSDVSGLCDVLAWEARGGQLVVIVHAASIGCCGTSYSVAATS